MTGRVRMDAVNIGEAVRREIAELQISRAAPITPLPDVLRDELARDDEQAAMTWTSKSWGNWLAFVPGIEEYLERMPTDGDGRVSRSSVREAVQAEGESAPHRFIAVMIWGYGTAGYGPYRTARVLTQAASSVAQEATGVSYSAIESLDVSQALARSGAGLEAFYYLNNDAQGRLDGLGSAFFTKWLYFASIVDDPDASDVPIFDERVRRWLRGVGAPGLRLRHNSTQSYAAYVALLSAWGHAVGVAPSRVERAIFALTARA